MNKERQRAAVSSVPRDNTEYWHHVTEGGKILLAWGGLVGGGAVWAAVFLLTGWLGVAVTVAAATLAAIVGLVRSVVGALRAGNFQ